MINFLLLLLRTTSPHTTHIRLKRHAVLATTAGCKSGLHDMRQSTEQSNDRSSVVYRTKNAALSCIETFIGTSIHKTASVKYVLFVTL